MALYYNRFDKQNYVTIMRGRAFFLSVADGTKLSKEILEGKCLSIH